MRNTLLILLLTTLAACGDDRDPRPGGGGVTADASTLQDAEAADTGPDPLDAGTTDAGTAMLCADYCSIAEAHCTGADQLYPDRASCLASCAAFPLGASSDQAGNSLYCRLYHVDQPAAQDPALHCPHAGASGGGVCS